VGVQKPELILFDLGGVLVEVASRAEIHAWMPTPLDLSQWTERWPAEHVFEAFEMGLLTEAEFGERFITEFPLTTTPDVFLAAFDSWVRGILPGTLDLLAELRDSFRLAALSNTNALHWKRLDTELGIPALFERVFTSYELGLRKPDPAIYYRTLSALGVEPGQVLFFDDNAANIATGRDLGMQAHRVDRPEGVRATLRELGLL
jgi:HAD superfamily hydrolase (TIGR01509 family)